MNKIAVEWTDEKIPSFLKSVGIKAISYAA